MGRKTKIWLILACVLMVFGGLIFGGVLALNNWDFTNISSQKYQTNTFETAEEFDNISIKTKTDDIVLKKSNEENLKIVFFEDEKLSHSAEVKDKTLKIYETDNRSWYDYIHFFTFDTTKITVCLPKDNYLSLNIQTDTGDIKLPKELNFKELKISGITCDVLLKSSVSGFTEIKVGTGDIKIDTAKLSEIKTTATTGDITLKNIECAGKIAADVSTGSIKLFDVKAKNIVSVGSTGDMYLKNVITKEKMSFERSTGDIKFVNCDADTIFAKTSTGDVVGSLLSEKIFITDTKTGSVKTPATANGGKCEIKTDTGDIKITVIQ